MHVARLIRNAERQKLCEELKKEIIDHADKKHLNGDESKRQKFFFCFYFTMMKRLIGIDHFHQLSSGMYEYEDAAGSAFKRLALPKIEEFARSPEEIRVIIGELMIWATRSALNPINLALQSQEISDPERIFHAPTAGVEVSEPW